MIFSAFFIKTAPVQCHGECHYFRSCLIEEGVPVCTGCQPGFTGFNCQTNINECDSNPCLNGGVCQDEVNAFSCVCKRGYWGKNCEMYLNIQKGNLPLNVCNSSVVFFLITVVS